MNQAWVEKDTTIKPSPIELWTQSILKSISVNIVVLGEVVFFLNKSIRLFFTKPSRMSILIQQLEFIGNKSVIIILLTGSFTGFALSYQIYMGFKLVNATNLVGPTVALGIFKELAPVLTGLIVAARAGGAMAAQIGTMRVTEQIDALEVMGVEPIQYLVSPRVIAAFIAVPMLCAIFDYVSIYSAEKLCVHVLGLDPAIFWDKINLWLKPRAVAEGLIKSAVFGLNFAVICAHAGYTAKGGARGVGQATNKGVVNSMVMIIILNFFISNLIRLYFSVMD